MANPLKILLLGKNGQVGWELQRSLHPLGELIALGRDSADYCGDLTNSDGLADAIESLRPNVIVNAAAYTAVDKAESEPDLACQINALASGVLAKAAQRIGALLVHYSTDYVFDGSGSKPWQENDQPAPISVYGQTKLEGEQLIAEHCERYLIFRTSWVYAARGGNFAKTMLRLAKERDELNVIADQIGAPTGADLIADVSAHAIRHVLGNPHSAGLYHLAAAGETSWHEYARFVIEHASAAGLQLKVKQNRINPIATSDYPTPAKRPHNSRLGTGKLQSSFGLYLPQWQAGVARMLDEII
jgi:dTDP-4-dehydrorhamnose reductase